MAKFSFSKRYNSTKIFDIDTEGFEYMNLEDLAEADAKSEEPQVYIIKGVYINKKSLYDPSPVVALDTCYVNLPAHLLDACSEMMSNPVAVKEINEGHCGFRIESYHQKKYNRDCYTVEWVDL